MTEHLYDISATELLSHSILDSEKTLISLKKKKKNTSTSKIRSNSGPILDEFPVKSFKAFHRYRKLLFTVL